MRNSVTYFFRTHKGKEVIPDGQRIRVINQPDGSTALLIDRATPQDAGEWAVVAVNDKGEVTSKADLLVAGLCAFEPFEFVVFFKLAFRERHCWRSGIASGVYQSTEGTVR